MGGHIIFFCSDIGYIGNQMWEGPNLGAAFFPFGPIGPMENQATVPEGVLGTGPSLGGDEHDGVEVNGVCLEDC